MLIAFRTYFDIRQALNHVCVHQIELGVFLSMDECQFQLLERKYNRETKTKQEVAEENIEKSPSIYPTYLNISGPMINNFAAGWS